MIADPPEDIRRVFCALSKIGGVLDLWKNLGYYKPRNMKILHTNM